MHEIAYSSIIVRFTLYRIWLNRCLIECENVSYLRVPVSEEMKSVQTLYYQRRVDAYLSCHNNPVEKGELEVFDIYIYI
jgi:hypothetical protein